MPAGRPKVYGKRITTAMRLPVRLHRRLHIEAARRGVAVNMLAERALEQYVEKLEKQKVRLP